MKSDLIKLDIKKQIIQSLLESDDASHFVKQAYAIINSSKKKISYAAMARKMDFKSRSFVRLLMEGDKKPNLSNFKKIGKGFDLSVTSLRYFELLIERENKSVNDQHKVSIELQELAQKLTKSLNRNIIEKKGSTGVTLNHWPLVYASLGEINTGRALIDIVKLSGLSKENCQTILTELIKQDLAGFNSEADLYYPTASIINIGQLGGDGFFLKHFKTNTQKALQLTEKFFNAEETLFYSSVFSVSKKNLPQLARQLQQVMSQFMLDAEVANGDELVTLNTSLVPQSL